jgi:hypothetical protein
MDTKIGSTPAVSTPLADDLTTETSKPQRQSGSDAASGPSWVERSAPWAAAAGKAIMHLIDATCAEPPRQPAETAPAKSPAEVRYETDLAAYREAIATNERVDSHNAAIDKEIAQLQKQYEVLDKLLQLGVSTGDGVLTRGELQHLALTSGDPEIRKAAQWLLGRSDLIDSLPRTHTLIGHDSDGMGIDVRKAQANLGVLMARIEELGASKLEHVKVPPEPVPPPPSHGVSAMPAGTPQQTETERGGGRTASPDANSAPTGEMSGGLDGAVEALYAKQSSLEQQIEAATAKASSDDPKVAAEGQRELQRLMNRQQAVANMLNLINTMMSNLAKLYSDMAMTAVRNMK